MQALAGDTETSLQVSQHQLRMIFQPKAVTREQEPQTLAGGCHQRTRWVKGNIYVMVNDLPLLAKPSARIIHFDLLYSLAIYFLLMASLVLSDIVFVFSVAGVVHSHLQGFSNTLWLLAIILFVVSTYTTITTEKGERNFNNVWIIILMYVTYSQLWLAVAVYGMGEYIREQVFHKQARWYKTKRFE